MPYSSSVTWSPQVAGPWVSDRCVMKCSGVAPCQCHSPDGVWTTSPGRMVTMGSPWDWTRPSPSMT